MKRSALGIIIAVAAVAGIAGVIIMSQNNDSSNDAPTAGQQAENSGHRDESSAATDMNEQTDPPAAGQVVISDFAFNPKTVTVTKGTTVTWTNQDSAKHDITPDQESEDFKASKLLAKGESYSFTFNKAGTYNYYCSPHPYMKASVVVAE